MKKKPLLPFLLLLSFPIVAAADTFVLKDGTEIEGSILRETPDSYVLEVQITKTIKDEKTIAKADVEKVKRTKPGEEEFEPIKELVPVPDQMDAAEYADRISDVERYLSKFKYGPRDKEAKAVLKTLKDEANEIIAGGIKINGKVIPAQVYRPNAYEIDARALASKAESLIAKSQYASALRVFDEMSKKYPNTEAYTKLAPLATRAARLYLAEVDRLLETFDSRAHDRKVGLERMTSADRAQTESAIAEQTANFEKRLKAEKDAGIGWVTIDPTFRPSLEATATYGKQQLNKMDALPSEPKVDAGRLYRDAYSLSHGSGEDAKEAKNAINAAKTAGVGPSYITALETAASAGGK
ncbi:MAG: hypothetical protein H7A49_12835 [Akkermansiaceae bacterium]|nr:hypothetical protein [Akkermansiaceae bacterium]